MPQSIVQPLRRWDPERIGPYSIIGKLGAGAMGQVFLARSAAGRLVAVKTIRVELAEEPGYRARFAREVAAASRVSGVFTAAVIQADAEADLPWVATAYVPAPSLSTLVRRCGPLPVPAVRWLAAGCAEALQSIHSVGLLHRDVKPSNVLVAPEGPQVIDFGVARVAERVQLTATRGAAGTPSYMAPEQARDATLVSPASDIFSLGATLVFAATGHPPYRGETATDILVRLATEAPDLTGLPSELWGLISACLQRVPRDRPTEASILAELGSFASGAGRGHSYLPDSAMALISEYQRNPRFPAEATNDDDDEDSAGSGTDGSAFLISGDATSGSHTALPGFESPAALYEAPGSRGLLGRPTRRAAHRHGLPRPRGSPGTERTDLTRRTTRSPERRTPLAWAGLVAAALVLVGAGIGTGLLLRGLGAHTAGNPNGPGTGPPCASAPLGGPPELCLSQPYGDGDTGYVIHGSGYVPGKPISVMLIGPTISKTSKYRPIADQEGTFSYTIDQGHVFFPDGTIPPGNYLVVVSAQGRIDVRNRFIVHSGNYKPPPITGFVPPAPPGGGAGGQGGQGGGPLLPGPP